ncbi:MAG: glycosyltransferase family 1 protein [Bacteroidetes bacterium]|nr:MAG: glycosyltransferase family 1 protein [Bacteroidota bacterium]
MKIAVWILADYKHQIGGGFALYDKFIQQIDNYDFSPEIEVCFIGQNSASNYKFKKRYTQLKFFGSLSNSLFSPLQKLFARFSHRIGLLNRFQKSILNSENIDLIFYPVQGFRKIGNFPFVVSNWDTGHKASYAFPELAMNYSFNYRDKWYSKDIFKALLVFAESVAGREELIYYTHLNPDRVKILPLFPGGVVDLQVDKIIQEEKLSHLKLSAGKYFFYPAQFWAHKNHYNLLVAFKQVVKEYPEFQLVLTGSDKGNKKYIVESVENLGLTDNVLFTGFIDNETMLALYSNAAAMVMPSFLGPTNMPLLEARLLHCPVLCSHLPGHKEIMQDGAFYFDPANAVEMANQMIKVLNDHERLGLLEKARTSINNSKFSTEYALAKLNEHFIHLQAIRKAWGKSDKIF